MKRATADSVNVQIDPQNAKKLKADDTDLFDPTLHRKMVDLLRPDTDNQDNGYITGRIFMIWPVRNGVHLMYFEAKEGDETYRFGIQLSGKYIDYVDVFNFRCHVPFHLALKGVAVEHKQESSAHNFAPLALIYNEGLAVKFITGEGTDGLVVDTWQLEKEQCPSSTWYSTPRNPRYIPRVSRAIMDDVAARPNENTLTVPQSAFASDAISSYPTRSERVPAVEKSHAQQTSGKSYKPSTSSVQGFKSASSAHNGHGPSEQSELSLGKPLKHSEGKPPKTTKSSIRKMKKRKRDSKTPLVAAATNEENRAPVSVPNLDVQSVNPPPASDAGPNITVAPPPVTRSPPISEAEEKLRKDAIQFKAGCRTETGESYIPLVRVKEVRAGVLFNTIGVVTSVRPVQQTRSNDWSVSFTIADFSNLEENQELGYLQNHGLTVNCFQNKYAEWLPSPKPGNIIILRRLKVSNFQGNTNATGHKDKLRWTHFNVETRVAHHGDRGSAPESERIDNGFGYDYSPFWSPQAKEIEYCNRLANWWQDLQRFLGEDVITVQVGATIKQARQHRLIADASPDLPPDGFFDCTAEILRGFENDNGPYCLYVTDYSVNDQMAKVESSWCPSHLKNRVLRVEAWDGAGQLARTMVPGEFWFLRNMKMRTGRLGYLEAKLQQAEKMCKLDDKNADSQPFLKALLERKKEFLETRGLLDGPCNKFDTKLIQDVDGDVTFFNCIAEVLYINHGSSQDTELYVTDYSFHPDLPSFSAEWAAGLEGRTVKIFLEGGQKSKAMDLIPGRYYIINNLRMIKRANAKHIHGRLGGDEQLIVQIDDLKDEDIQILLKRKDQWKREIERDGCARIPIKNLTELPPNNISSSAAVASELVQQGSTISIKDLLASDTCPNVFRIVGRVTDFYPFDLKDCVVPWCSNCRQDIPSQHRQCLKCDDLVTNNVKCLYRFFFYIEDDSGAAVQVAVCYEECPLLKGLPPVDLRDNQDALKQFTARLQPIIGNLVEVHGLWLDKKWPDIVTPKLEFTIDSWEIENGKARAYGLIDHRTP